MTDIEEAKRLVKQEEERVAKEKEAARLAKRGQDRQLRSPAHFHATVMCFVEKDGSGNFKDMQHNEVLGLSPDACIRKALNRSEDRQVQYHLVQLTECAESHGIGRLEE